MSRAALLSLVQWLSPAFPTGAFAYSHGLEQVIADGAVADAPSLERWLRAVLEHGAGWQDAVLLAQALRAGADMDALDALARALQPSAERLSESCDQGVALARTVAAMTGRALPARPLPVALGEAAAPLGLPPGDVIALYLHGFAGNLVTIAIRHVPLGQTEGQGVLARLGGLIERLAEAAARAEAEEIGTAVLAADLAAMRHETMDVRIFRT
ncbi:urease accessory protein UreF [Alkalilacustris brevis]|uniref:urease accessory protein UreF n=1 Tax=Alkalilacustris brevis TaxID=2026338 RepID=UPI000E0D36DC|nr:urease accessory UreF family protein [Alkalilacustris brevis]